MTSTTTKRVLSYGGGLDSFAMLLLAIEQGDLPDAVAFVDVGDGAIDRDGQDPAEWPGTYRHLREVVAPLCERHGIEFVWIDSACYPVREARSLFAWMDARQQIPIAGPDRICTTIAKVERFERWLGDRFPGELVEVWIGFEAGEEKRSAKDPNAGKPSALRRNRYPLQEVGLCRCRCEALAIASGMPVPRKSACVFCPFATRQDFRNLRDELPGTFAAVAALEERKPPTKKNGKKLSIKAYDGRRKNGPANTPLPIFVEQADKPAAAKKLACSVCGAKVRATKETACGYLAEGAAATAAA